MHFALYEPEIAQNVGTIIRLCACFGYPLDLIEPFGFVWNTKHLKRSAMDYLGKVNITKHACFEDFKQNTHKRIVLVDVNGKIPLWDFSFEQDDIVLFGKESIGVPDAIKQEIAYSVYIPMLPHVRSLNLAITCAMVASKLQSRKEG